MQEEIGKFQNDNSPSAISKNMNISSPSSVNCPREPESLRENEISSENVHDTTEKADEDQSIGSQIGHNPSNQAFLKHMFEMHDAQLPFAAIGFQEYGLPGLSGIGQPPSLTNQAFWSNNNSGSSDDYYSGFAQQGAPFSFPNLPTAQMNTMFNQNFFNAQLALNAQQRRSPVDAYNAHYGGQRHNPNLFQVKNFHHPSVWPNNSQSHWNAPFNPSWNHMQKRFQDRGSGYDSMTFPQLENSLLEIMRCEIQPDHTKAPFSYSRRKGRNPFFMNGLEDFDDHVPSHLVDPSMAGGSKLSVNMPLNHLNERFSRKVFVGGLPPDIDEEEITASFRRFGPLVVDWPHKAESKSYFPPKGYAFLLFQEEASVQSLINACMNEDGKLFLCVSSPTIKEKPVQVRPWNLAESDYVMDGGQPLDPRKTIFVGGVPRPLKAKELAMIMDRLYGGVCYAGIDTDPELKYPKGAGRVAFSTQQSYIAAISARFVQLQHGDIDKRVEVKPYVLDDQMCDECRGQRCNGKYAPYFCANVTCLQYFCDNCWSMIHSRPGREYHKPLVKEGGGGGGGDRFIGNNANSHGGGAGNRHGTSAAALAANSIPRWG